MDFVFWTFFIWSTVTDQRLEIRKCDQPTYQLTNQLTYLLTWVGASCVSKKEGWWKDALLWKLISLLYWIWRPLGGGYADGIRWWIAQRNTRYTRRCCCKGRMALPKRMNFRKNSKRPLTPFPHPSLIFGKSYSGFFQEYMTEEPFIMAKICNINFWIVNDPPPFWNFSENSSIFVGQPVPYE